MRTPPPLPTLGPVMFELFKGESRGGIRFDVANALSERVESAHLKAEAWMKSRPDIEIVSISNGHASQGDVVTMVYVTVWYRERL